MMRLEVNFFLLGHCCDVGELGQEGDVGHSLEELSVLLFDLVE